MKKNILIITEAMKPFTEFFGGCQRVYYYSHSFLDRGYNIHIICRNQSLLDESTIKDNGLIITGRGKPVLKKNESTKGAFGVAIKQGIKKRILSSTVIRSIFRFFYSDPNIFDGFVSKKWALNNTQFVLDYIRTNRIDIVIISGPPFGSFYNVKKIKNNEKVKIILDYRDPWTLWYERFSLASIAEKSAIQEADYVITAAEPLTLRIKEKYSADNVATVLNGYNEKSWSTINTKRSNDRFVISYVGLITLNSKNSFRNPTNLIKAADVFLSRHPDSFLKIVGVSNLEHLGSQGLNERIHFCGKVPVNESYKIMSESSVLVVLHTAKNPSGKYIICGKIYDYMRSGNYILSIGEYALANKSMVETNHAGIHCDNSVNSILDSLEKLYAMWKENKKIIIPNIEYYSRDYQNAHFTDLVESIMNRK